MEAGTEKITFYKMLPEMGPPETRSWEYLTADVSWENEINAFFDDIELNKEPNPSIIDAFKSMEIIQKSTKNLVMIIVRSPLRISLGGGGTDLASYYEENEGFSARGCYR